MKHIVRIILKRATPIVLLLCSTAIWFYFEMQLPYKTVSNPGWWHLVRFEDDYVPNKKICNACHKILRYRFGYHDDAALALGYFGDKDSIPYLIRALKWQNIKHPNADFTDAFAPRAFLGCIGSLKKLTGMDFGADHAKWLNWWEQTGCHLTFDENKGQLVSQEETK